MRPGEIERALRQQTDLLTNPLSGWDDLDPALTQFLESLRDGVVIVDADRRIKYRNSAYLQQFELEPTDVLIGQDLYEVMLHLARERKLGDLQGRPPEVVARERVANWGSNHTRVEHRELASGRSLDIYRTLATDGHVISVHVDITETDRSAAELERSRSYMQSVLANTSDAITLLDAERNFVMFNEKLLELYDIDPSQVYWGIPYDDMVVQFGDLKKLPPAERADEIRRRRDFAFSPEILTVRRPLNDGRTLNINKTNLADGGCVLTIRDITEDLRREEELIAARREAEKTSRHKSEFVARMSHEMRTPLNGILGSAALLGRTDMDEKQRMLVEVISNSGTVLLRLIDDILDLSRIEAESFEVIEGELDIANVVAQCLGIVRPAAEDAGLDLRCAPIPEGLPRLRGDEIRVKQILLNLLTNAVKFTESGSVDVTIDASEGPEGITLRLGVADTGVGIAKDQLSQIFERFYQIDGTATRRHGGAGLGLAITKRLVDLMGGAIQVRSEPGVGTTFLVTLTLQPVRRSNASLKSERRQ